MATFNDPYGIGTGIGQYYQGALAQDPRMAAINRNMSGQVAPDVRNQLAQAAAERGVGIGSYGSGNDQSAFLRSLGLTSMDLTNKGIGQYGEAYNQVPQLRPGELFVSPTDEANMATQQRLQTERLNSEAGLQAGKIGASAYENQANRQRGAEEFNIKRTDQLALNKAKSDAYASESKVTKDLNAILSRLSPGSSYDSNAGTLGTGEGYSPSSFSNSNIWAGYNSQPKMGDTSQNISYSGMGDSSGGSGYGPITDSDWDYLYG